MITSILPLLITTPLGAILSASCANRLVKRSHLVAPDKVKDELESKEIPNTKDDISQND